MRSSIQQQQQQLQKQQTQQLQFHQWQQQQHSGSNAICPAAAADCACRPAIANPEDYEIRVQVDFENRLIRPLGVAGFKQDASSEVLLFAREKCRPDCCVAGCGRCRTRKLFQGAAVDPQGTVTFRPHDEYLYCLRFDQRQPATALLLLTPREQNVEVKEIGLLAYWFATWFQRAKVAHANANVWNQPEDPEAAEENDMANQDTRLSVGSTLYDDDTFEGVNTAEQRKASATAAAATQCQRMSGADINKRKSGADVTQRTSCADVTQRKSCADVTQRMSGADVTQRMSCADVNQRKSCADVTQRKSCADVTQRKSSADVTQRMSGADVTQRMSGADVTQRKSGADVNQRMSMSGADDATRRSRTSATADGTDGMSGADGATRRSRTSATADGTNRMSGAADATQGTSAAADITKTSTATAENSKRTNADMAPSKLTAGQIFEIASVNATSKYLPNLRIVYQVRKNRMMVTMSNPQQLRRPIEVLLTCRSPDVEPRIQATTLSPGVAQASCELFTTRDVGYTLMVKLKDLGKPVELLDLITERKVLRVQESREAPKHMNFLMERRVDQRATFVLHVTFDEKIITVDNNWLGEFYLDVDAENQSLAIGTVEGNERKTYRVEKLLCGPDKSPASAEKQLIFEGGVDPCTLFTTVPIRIQKMCDYMITVIDPDASTVTPTTVLSFQKTALFVKEIKGSEVKLHVTVQRQLTVSGSARNANNLQTAAREPDYLQQYLPVVRRSQLDGAFHCPIREGCTKYRILHNAAGRSGSCGSGGYSGRQRSVSRCSASTVTTAASAAAAAAAAATDAAVAAADASCYSSGGCTSSTSAGGTTGTTTATGCDDSGFGRNHQASNWSESQGGGLMDTCQHQPAVDFNVNLDVHLPTLQARLLPAGANDDADSCRSGGVASSGCYLIVEESQTGGRQRSVPCQLGQAFSVQHWCKYTVKSIDERLVSPLFTFYLTDTEVTDVRACNPMVRLSRKIDTPTTEGSD